jgi:Ni/Fe-hydrogenase b-type cytochrome subunit
MPETLYETTDVFAPSQRTTYRHKLPIRLTHWINAIALIILMMSGFQIFNAHPALYWGDRSDPDKAILEMRGVQNDAGERMGMTTIFGYEFNTTGIFGASENSSGKLDRRGFPSWATIPGDQWLAMGRRWHLFFAWVFVINAFIYVLYSLLSRHFSRDLVPDGKELRGIGGSVRDHLLFRHPQGAEAARYNVLQKLAYVAVMFVMLPIIVLAGLAMSPWLDAVFPWLPELFGGRQAARTVHFIIAFGFIGFIIIHVFMVLVTGVWNNLRSMITGRYKIKE